MIQTVDLNRVVVANPEPGVNQAPTADPQNVSTFPDTPVDITLTDSNGAGYVIDAAASTADDSGSPAATFSRYLEISLVGPATGPPVATSRR